VEFRVYCSCKPETRQQLVQMINKAAVGIRNELEHMQWGQSLSSVYQHACGYRMPTLSSEFKGVHTHFVSN
jgi:hypothetical protein